jgi:hypothetical protein
MHKFTFIISMIITLSAIGSSQAQPDINKSVCNRNEVAEKHQTGFCLVAAEADSMSSLPAARDD